MADFPNQTPEQQRQRLAMGYLLQGQPAVPMPPATPPQVPVPSPSQEQPTTEQLLKSRQETGAYITPEERAIIDRFRAQKAAEMTPDQTARQRAGAVISQEEAKRVTPPSADEVRRLREQIAQMQKKLEAMNRMSQ